MTKGDGMESRLGTPERPQRPQSLRELYEMVVRASPEAVHDEEKFVQSVIQTLEKDPIRTRSIKTEVLGQKLGFSLGATWPLNDFWYAANEYLKNLNVADAESKIRKLAG